MTMLMEDITAMVIAVVGGNLILVLLVCITPIWLTDKYVYLCFPSPKYYTAFLIEEEDIEERRYVFYAFSSFVLPKI